MATIRSVIYGNPSTKTAEITLLLRSPEYRTRIMIIVEGEDDKELYDKFFDSATSKVHDIGGCDHFMNILGELAGSQFEQRFIIIKDSDFDRLNNTTYPYSNLFLTDAHDAEMMIMSQASVDTLSIKHLRRVEPDLFKDASDAIISLSFLKWYNDRHGIPGHKICFKNITVDKIWHHTMSACHTEVYSHPDNVSKARVTLSDVEAFARANSGADLFQLLNGHDMCDALMNQIKSIKMSNITKKSIPKHFRDNFTIRDFKNTQLYSGLVAWFDYNYNKYPFTA